MTPHQQQTLRIGEHSTVAMLVDDHGGWHGFGAIHVDGQALRDPDQALSLCIDTPLGIRYTRYTLDDIHTDADETAVHLTAHGISWGRREYLDEHQHEVIDSTFARAPMVADRVTIYLRPVTETIGGQTWHGFSWRFGFVSDEREIHRLLVSGSWELDGTIVGKTVLSQGQINKPAYVGAKETLFTTNCLRTVDDYGSPQGCSYQLTPRGGLLQGFDFQHDESGALFAYWPALESVSAVVESPPNDSHLYAVDEYRFELTKQVATAPQHILYCQSKLAPHEGRNLWWAASEHAYGGLRKHHGVGVSRVQPAVHHNLHPSSVHGDDIRVEAFGITLSTQEYLPYVADQLLPRLAEQGIQQFAPFIVMMTDPTEIGLTRKLDNGIHGTHICSSVCVVWRHLPAEMFGGMAAWRYMYQKAQRLGIKIGVKIFPNFSPRADIFKEHPDWLMRNQSGVLYGGGYKNISTYGDWNTGLFDWVLDDVCRWRDEGGIDFIMIHDVANHCLVGRNYAAGMRDNWAPLCRFLGELQARGFDNFATEGVSPFMTSHFGCCDTRKDLPEEQRGPVAQNDFAWWVDHPDMFYRISLHCYANHRTLEWWQAMRFRALANQGDLTPIDQGSGSEIYTFHPRDTELNHIYNQALPYMVKRELLPDQQGVRWHSDGHELLWAFVDLTRPEGQHGFEVTANGLSELTDDTHSLVAERVYLFKH